MDTQHRPRSTAVKGDLLFEFAILADTHLGPVDGVSPSPWETNRLANARARAAIAQINRRNPAFVVHLGDMVHPVPAHPGYLPAAQRFREIFGSLEAPLHLVAGNHDVGDKPTAWSPAPAINARFMKLYEENFGRQFYSFGHAGARFVVVNNALFNSDLPEAAAQWAWLEQELAGHERIFIFTHYPAYLRDEGESEHSDNIAEPARRRFLSLVRRHRVEAVFAGHVHNFFYDCDDAATEFYVAPTTGAVRHDYSELFSATPADEFGRNDLGKLGYLWVEVRSHGHVAHYVRTDGSVADGADLPAPALHTKALPASRLGIDLRHAWAQAVAIPITGALDEFGRKWVRNDYLVAAIWEMGVGWLRVPLEDIISNEARSRMRLLRRSGLRFTVFGFGLPEERTVDVLRANGDCYDRLEIILPRSAVESSLREIAMLRRQIGKRLYLSRLRTSADEAEQTGRYAHFIDCGFHVEDASFLQGLTRLGEAIDGIVFRTYPGERATAVAPAILGVAAPMGLGACLSVRMSGPDPARHYGSPEQTAALACDALEAAYAAPDPFDVVLDTVIDVDRGYFPRCGLLDRRYNHTAVSQALIAAHRRLLHGAKQKPMAGSTGEAHAEPTLEAPRPI
jgi:predicted phosphodiesterase